jgi:hypothetical protein
MVILDDKNTLSFSLPSSSQTRTYTTTNSSIISVPGYLQMTYGTDFKVEDKIGSGGTATVLMGTAVNQKLRVTAGGEKIVVKKFSGKISKICLI